MKLAQNIVLMSVMMGAMGAAIPSPAEEEAKRSSIPREESDTIFTWSPVKGREESDTVFTWSPMKARDESDIVFTWSPMKVREDPESDNVFTWSPLKARRIEVLDLECLQIDSAKAMSSFDEQEQVHFSSENAAGSTDTEKDTNGGTKGGEEVSGA
ncbi:hypothetical protein GGU11DRAFT_753296 [Lentinula aff. detonsa]|nr:hypothetical protein GGU11DRAFT_753296 [Lentinula aff. detonsa]